jgi:hypothetical protein
MTVFYGDQDPLNATLGQSLNLPMPLDSGPANFPIAGEAAEAALRQYNAIRWIYDAFTRTQPDATPQQGYDAVPLVAGTKYEPYASQFLGDVNPAQTRARMAIIDRNLEDQRILAASGWTGTLDIVAAILANPLWLLVLWFCLRLWTRHPDAVPNARSAVSAKANQVGRVFGKESFRLLIFAIVALRKVWRSATLNLQLTHGRIRDAVREVEKNEKR